MNRYTQTGCIALVTGAASGLGKGLADALAQRGLTVIYADINGDGATAAADAAGPQCEGVRLDVADSAACIALIDDVVGRRGRLDLLLNCAGYAVSGEAQHTSVEDWDRVVAVNLMGNIHPAIHAYKQMVRQGGGHIVTIASLAGLLPFPMATSYATTKAGLVNFSHTLRCEGAGLGVQVSVVCPSFIDTAIFDNAVYLQSNKDGLKEMIPLPIMPLDKAVRETLAGIDANRGTIVFPFHAKLAWWLQRLFPRNPNLMTTRMMARVRAMKKP